MTMPIEMIVRTALRRDSLQLCSMVQDFLRSNVTLASVAPPDYLTFI
jgi:hypothetical protein